MNHRPCLRCGLSEPEVEFGPNKMVCQSCRSRAKSNENRKNRYGMTEEQYQELFDKQGGLCAICRNPETLVQYGKVLPLSVDHDHNTNRIRGLLCQGCNRYLLGGGNDNPEIHRSAILYLEASNEQYV